MANHYLQFSVELKLNSKEELHWMERYLPLFDVEVEDDGAPELLKSLAREAEIAETPEGYDNVKRFVNEECCQSWQIDEDERGDRVWFFAEESGEPEMILSLVHIFLARFKRDDAFVLTWAAYCDKLRLEEFGGGAGYATKEDFDLKGESWWVDDAIRIAKGKEP